MATFRVVTLICQGRFMVSSFELLSRKNNAKTNICSIALPIVVLATAFGCKSRTSNENNENNSGAATQAAPAPEPKPEEYQITGVLRDFKKTHPDMERQPGVAGFKFGSDKLFAADTLSADGKPQWKQKSFSVTSQANFEQWFRDVPGVNIAVPLALKLRDDDKNGTYTYYNAAFWPINNMGFGNEGLDKNFHFTYELKGQFVYNGGEMFEFRGDDDVFVYFNGKKVIDLGGVHLEEVGTVKLDDVAAKCGLKKGENASFHMFFAERHTTKSNFKIESTMEFIPPPKIIYPD
jgi:fibro-slime domain-containing protein